MRDTRVEEEFARFAEEAAGTFRPPPVDALPRRSRRRRLRVWLTGVMVAVVAVGGGVALRPAGSDPEPKPAPTGFRIVERPVVLAGATGPHQVRFADRDHGWALFQDCADAAACARATSTPRLGRTDDGGRTWHPLNLPDLRGDDGKQPWLQLAALGGRTIGLIDQGRAWWASTDGGDTWTRDEYERWMEAWFRAAQPHPDRFTTTCPQPLTDACVTGRLLVDGVDVGVVPARAGWTVRDVARGAGGTMWATMQRDRLAGDTVLMFSADGAAWRDVQVEPMSMHLWPSADREDVWLVEIKQSRLFRLTPDGRAQEQSAGPSLQDFDGVAVIGGGRLLVASTVEGLRVWSAGGYETVPVPVHGDPGLQLLDDGAVQLTDTARDATGKETVTVGTLGGEWVRYP